jgi:hypothetical protein
MTVHINGSKGKELYYGGTKIKEAYYNGNKVYSSGPPLYYCYSLSADGRTGYVYSTPNNVLSLYIYGGNMYVMATQSSELEKYFLDASSGNEQYIIMVFWGESLRFERYEQGDLYT